VKRLTSEDKMMPNLSKRPLNPQLVEEIARKKDAALKNMRYGAAIKDKKEVVLEQRIQQGVEQKQQLAQQVEHKLEAVESKKSAVKSPKFTASQPKPKATSVVVPKVVAPTPKPVAFKAPQPKPTNSSLLEKFLKNHPELSDRIAKILPHSWMQKAIAAAALVKKNESRANTVEQPTPINENENTAPTPFQTVPRPGGANR
jgi:hypothetical protein